MKRSVFLWTVTVVIAAGSWTEAGAQAASEDWDVVIAPYLTGASMSGTTTVRGLSVDIDACFGMTC